MRLNAAVLVLAFVVPLVVTGAVAAQTGGGGVSGLIELLESIISVLESLLDFLRSIGSGM
ncbi:hypothetical protein ACFQL1_01780 [Halomicroarcula sp. GCM10025709]|uniref:hypothetical protein n=1 Tax=Haloarcula TaxID=2237 RepID=UPI0024C37ED9|nr:hypothetical protein [Halomicroarcula sp. YJ-61-S]